MAKFHGKVGYGQMEQTAPGVHAEVITEFTYTGDVIRNTRELTAGDNLNGNISTTNSISILADEYANAHIFAIRYVEWSGVLWRVSSVEVQRPRLLLRLGEVYNGPKG